MPTTLDNTLSYMYFYVYRKAHKIYPFEVRIEKGNGNLQKNSKVNVDQISTIDKSRCISLIGELGENYLEKAMRIHLALNR